MAILVVGNGFDIAHGLPTAYADFLDFITLYCTDNERFDKIAPRTPALAKFVKRMKEEDSAIGQEIHRLLSRINCLLGHFTTVYEERCNQGKRGWVDFEAEISWIVQLFERARQEQFANNKYLSNDLSVRIKDFIFSDNGEIISPENILVIPGFIERIAEYRLNELNVITRLLEIYLAEYVDKLQYVDTLPQISAIPDITHVISFNYTSTYQRLYGKEGTKYCYIHGKAEENSSVDDTNIILGIDEYLKGDAQNNDNVFIKFKKFYQRIYKETSSEYIDWLENHSENCEIFQKSKIPILDIYFYGHSLDVTDKDVLEKLILHENAKIHFFYRNKAQKAKQITNLNKIIGEENLIKMTRGSKRAILFEPVCGACPTQK